ncbi:hypothetical protein PRUPE_1G570700 [Prunus persica]|uniref:Cupin type-1 domain-containing protein n=1 Tax=Prunus persica TaxID=3760 RepID=A0A251RJ77_PRUPE|nr:hypothetical protein PRUPE_1G570700 [Prunus persica]
MKHKKSTKPDWVLIIKVGEDEKIKMPKPSENSTHKLVHKITSASATTLTEKEFPLLKEAGLSASLITLEANAINSPIYTTDTTVQVVYVAGGSGQIQIVGLNGKLALDTQVKALVICLWFQASSWLVKLAGENGLECFSVITSSQPVLEDLAGKISALVVALSPEMLQISLNITPELQDLLRSRIKKI